MNTLIPTTNDEQTLLGVVRRLPPEHVAEVIDFARFLHYRRQQGVDFTESGDLQTSVRFAESNVRWEDLLATEESQRLLERMTDEVVAEIEAGLAQSMVFTNDGEIAPG